MDFTSFTSTFSNDLSLRKTIVLVANCSIEYWGRSRSVIGLGDRILFFKPDSTIIIHSPSGFKPINWMSSPSDTSCTLDEGKPLIFSQRTVKPFEEIRIKIAKIIRYNGFDYLYDGSKQLLTHTELDMRNHLESNPKEVHSDFRFKSKEKKTPVGLIDLWGKIGEKYCVVELKAVKAGLPAVLQLKRYRDWMSEQLNQNVLGILMAPSIAKNPLELIKKEGLIFTRFNVKKLKIEPVNHTLDDWI